MTPIIATFNKDKYWDKAWQLVDGCSPVSAGCDNCWSAGMTHRFKQGLTDKGKFNSAIRIREDKLDLPLKTKKPTVFSVWNDLFYEDVPDEFITSVWMTMLSADRHTYLVLTKRPKRMVALAKKMFKDLLSGEPAIQTAKHIYLGTSIENQQTANERIPHLLQIQGKKFLSIEPMLAKIIIPPEQLKEFSQVICGGETGKNARPCHPDWVRSIRDQCQAAGVPFFFKSLGMWRSCGCGKLHDYFDHSKKHFYSEKCENVFRKKKAGRILDGITHDDLVWGKL